MGRYATVETWTSAGLGGRYWCDQSVGFRFRGAFPSWCASLKSTQVQLASSLAFRLL
ncbi:MAG: hypothetical protein ACI915_003798 [Gammaproteobacteria bacterium]|jgi:hypothetical protein